jgi:hypothetical protein
VKRTAIILAVLLALAVPVFAAEDEDKATKQDNFSERKAQILKKLNDQIRNLQEAKTCVQAAKDQDAIKTCREKQMAERKQLQEEMRKKSHRDEQQNK